MRPGPHSPLERLRASPHLLLPALGAWLRGWWCRLKFLLQGKHFSAGKLFRVYGPFYLSGPGRVSLGDDCLVVSNTIKPVCIRTLTPAARVTIGDRVGLNGTSIQCAQEVRVGRLSAIADAYITDTRGHRLDRDRRSFNIEDEPSAPVLIGENVWVSVQVVITAGVRIGDNSVIGACSLVRHPVPGDVFAAGNPLAIIREIEG